jgi:hypothetical protein
MDSNSDIRRSRRLRRPRTRDDTVTALTDIAQDEDQSMGTLLPVDTNIERW